MTDVAVKTDANPNTQNEQQVTQADCCQPQQTLKRAVVARPATDVSATEQALLIEVELPGIPPENVEVRTEDRTVIITGANEVAAQENTGADTAEAKTEGAEQGAKAYHREWARRRYERRFRVGEDYDLAKTSAAYKHGVLSLRIEKAEQLKPRKIDIQVS